MRAGRWDTVASVYDDRKRRVWRRVLIAALVIVFAIVLLYAVVIIGGHWWENHYGE
jgi:membrane-associated phospholipid phosphatase